MPTQSVSNQRRHWATPRCSLADAVWLNAPWHSPTGIPTNIYAWQPFRASKKLRRGHGKQPSFVTSQTWIRAADLDNPNPNSREVEGYLNSFGFTPWGLRRNAWIREDGMYILDAHNQNFIKFPAGIVPVDLVIGIQSSGISFLSGNGGGLGKR